MKKKHKCEVWVVVDEKYGVLYSCATKIMAKRWYSIFGSIGGRGCIIEKYVGETDKTKNFKTGYETKEEVKEWLK